MDFGHFLKNKKKICKNEFFTTNFYDFSKYVHARIWTCKIVTLKHLYYWILNIIIVQFSCSLAQKRFIIRLWFVRGKSRVTIHMGIIISPLHPLYFFSWHVYYCPTQLQFKELIHYSFLWYGSTVYRKFKILVLLSLSFFSVETQHFVEALVSGGPVLCDIKHSRRAYCHTEISANT